MLFTLVPDFRAQVMAVDRVERLLHQVATALDAAGIPYAIIGGNAVAAWVATVDEAAVRATKDVDILLRRGDLGAAAKALESTGLACHDVHGVTMFLPSEHHNPKTGVHVVFALEPVREHEHTPAPDVTGAVRAPSGVMVIDLAALLTMKLQAFRRVDQVHIEDMLSVGIITSQIEAKLPAELRERLNHIRTTR